MSVLLNELLEQRKQIEAQIKALSADDIQKAEREKVQSDIQADVDTLNSSVDSQISNTQNYYKKLEDDTKTAYESQYARNAVQKLVNEKLIAEKNANLGLSDSGLNRTQQTAVQLSYANQKGNIDVSKQNALDELSLKLTDAVTTLQNNKASSIRDITNQWNSYADSRASSLYETQYNGLVDQYNEINNQITDTIEAENNTAAQMQAAAIATSTKQSTVSYGAGGTSAGNYIISSPTGTLSRDYMGTLKDNGVYTVYNYNPDGSMRSVTYTDSNSGITATFDAGVNPYTGKMNKDLCDERGYYDQSKAFDNGYQPNNINGEKLKATDATWIVYDREQKVFKLKSTGEYYVWRGEEGRYQKLTDEEKSYLELK